MSAHEIFCSWDFRISNEKAAEMKKYSIYNELKFILDNVCDSVEIRSKRTGFWVLVTQISANVFVFGILCGVGYFVWTLLHVRDAKQIISPDNTYPNVDFFFSDDHKYGIEF